MKAAAFALAMRATHIPTQEATSSWPRVIFLGGHALASCPCIDLSDFNEGGRTSSCGTLSLLVLGAEYLVSGNQDRVADSWSCRGSHLSGRYVLVDTFGLVSFCGPPFWRFGDPVVLAAFQLAASDRLIA
jgi:hypothetical protein